MVKELAEALLCPARSHPSRQNTMFLGSPGMDGERLKSRSVAPEYRVTSSLVQASKALR